MPETSDNPVTTAQLAAGLAGLTVGPYADATTSGAADLAAETIRYLNHAAAKGGITEPATIAAVTSSLTTAAYRLPQLLHTISEWLRAETTAGRIADDHRRSPDQLTARIVAAITQAADNADDLAASVAAVHNLTATLHTASPPPRPPKQGNPVTPQLATSAAPPHTIPGVTQPWQRPAPDHPREASFNDRSHLRNVTNAYALSASAS
jgi:hypothetical protein